MTGDTFPVLDGIAGSNQVWPVMAAKYGVENPVPPWKSSLDGLCDALDRAACETTVPDLETAVPDFKTAVPDFKTAVPDFKARRDDEDELSATVYAGLPYPENQLMALAHSLVTRGVISEADLVERLAAVRARLEA